MLAFRVAPAYDLIYLNSHFGTQTGVTYGYGFVADKIVGVNVP